MSSTIYVPCLFVLGNRVLEKFVTIFKHLPLTKSKDKLFRIGDNFYFQGINNSLTALAYHTEYNTTLRPCYPPETVKYSRCEVYPIRSKGVDLNT